ncbi:MAG TPA: PilZ domain-containing protein [Polyangia bacterium]|jgi:hypothetical protein
MSIGASLISLVDPEQQHPPRRGRFGVAIRVELGGDGADGAPASTRNISLEGAFITTRRALRVGEALKLRFWFPGYQVPISIPAEVRWIRPAGQGDNRPAGAGVQFVDPSIAASAAIVGLARLRDDL